MVFNSLTRRHHKKQPESPKKIILFYNTMWGNPHPYSKVDISESFMLSNDRRLMKKAVAVVFHIPSFAPPVDEKAQKTDLGCMVNEK